MYCQYCERETFEDVFHSNELGLSFHSECIFRMLENDPDDMEHRLLYLEWSIRLKDEKEW
ncbi:hypothetical protein ACTWQB_16805 [Piscibacillus sp. B03]|uniref:hypothetical protein n=1 Tax=Piscibacillus sp. B03 TaxID=3457430 RepID=UPI003FCD6D0F